MFYSLVINFISGYVYKRKEDDKFKEMTNH